jgi:hypothetical protein
MNHPNQPSGAPEPTGLIPRIAHRRPPDNPDPETDDYRLTLVHEKHAREQVSQAPAKCCQCERERPYTRPNWDIDLAGGHCRSCDLPLREQDVRRWHAIALAVRSGLVSRGWYG